VGILITPISSSSLLPYTFQVCNILILAVVFLAVDCGIWFQGGRPGSKLLTVVLLAVVFFVVTKRIDTHRG
jgi:hypothetical protein